MATLRGAGAQPAKTAVRAHERNMHKGKTPTKLVIKNGSKKGAK